MSNETEEKLILTFSLKNCMNNLYYKIKFIFNIFIKIKLNKKQIYFSYNGFFLEVILITNNNKNIQNDNND